MVKMKESTLLKMMKKEEFLQSERFSSLTHGKKNSDHYLSLFEFHGYLGCS